MKVQAPGPLTLAAQVELANGHRVLTDPGAVRDLSASLAEGLAEHAAEVGKRLGANVVVQLDEPSLTAVLDGSIRGRACCTRCVRCRSPKPWTSSTPS